MCAYIWRASYCFALLILRASYSVMVLWREEMAAISIFEESSSAWQMSKMRLKLMVNEIEAIFDCVFNTRFTKLKCFNIALINLNKANLASISKSCELISSRPHKLRSIKLVNMRLCASDVYSTLTDIRQRRMDAMRNIRRITKIGRGLDSQPLRM